MSRKPQGGIVKGLVVAGVLTLLAGCVEVGPDYVRPAANVPAAYKEAAGGAAHPRAPMPADWWNVYHDGVLDDLMARMQSGNQSLAAAAARVREARALVRVARGSQQPTVAIGSVKTGRKNENDFGIGVSWEVDLWGRIRRDVEAHRAMAEASADDLAAATLSMQAELVQAYFALREQDALLAAQQQGVAANARWVTIVRNQAAQGVVSGGDVAKALAQLGAARTQRDGGVLARAQLEHAIAVMLGEPPADFSLAPAPLVANVPVVPAGLPSSLLQRRPDVAAAERRMAAASAQIGVRKAERLPSINLVAGIGVLHGWFATPDVKAPLYAGGALHANVTHAQAAYAEAVANYRATVLNALREVEDNLAAERLLGNAAKTHREAADLAQAATTAATNQYHAGVASYQSVVAARAAALDGTRAELDLRLRRLDTSVNLVKALGGGWDVPAREPGAAGKATTPPAASAPK